MNTSGICNVLNPKERFTNEALLLNIILTYLYSLRNEENLNQRSKTIDEIVIGVQNTNPQLTFEQIEIGVRLGSRQGLFSLICSDDFTQLNAPRRYEFNRNAPLVNTKNWKYLCGEAKVMFPGSCCSKPCRCTKGSFELCEPQFLPPSTIQNVTIPGVPGSFTRIAPEDSCPIPI